MSDISFPKANKLVLSSNDKLFREQKDRGTIILIWLCKFGDLGLQDCISDIMLCIAWFENKITDLKKRKERQ